MITENSTRTPTANAPWKCLRALVAATLFIVSALLQATLAPHAALSATLEFCVDDHAPADRADKKTPAGAPALGHAHCRACPIATPPSVPEKPSIARVAAPPVPLVYSDGWGFEPQVRRRPGETRSRAPPFSS
ncbi:MAG: hypothetical protein U1E25_10535 [Methylocystis sp.]